jgi:hypothetical protein
MIKAVIFLWLGMGVMWPWNAFISAKSYMTARMPPPTSDWEAWCSTLFNGGSVLSLLLWLLFYFPSPQPKSSQRTLSMHPTIKSIRRDDYYWVMISLGLYLGVFLLTTLGVLWIPSSTTSSSTTMERWFQVGTYGGIIVCGMAASVASAGIVGMAATTATSAATVFSASFRRTKQCASIYDEEFGIAYYFTGQAMGGLVVAMGNWVAQWYDLQFILLNVQDNYEEEKDYPTKRIYQYPSKHNNGSHAKAALSATTKRLGYTQISWPTFWYFATSCLVLGLCMIGYTYLATINTSNVVDRKDNDDAYNHYYDNISSTGEDRIDESTPLVVKQKKCHSLSLYSDYRANSTTTSPTASTQMNRVRHVPSTTSLETTDSSCCSWTVIEDQEHVPSTPSFNESMATTPTIQTYSKDSGSSEEDDYYYSSDHSHHHSTKPKPGKNYVMQCVWNAIEEPTLSLFITYFVTLLLFPVWTSELTTTMIAVEYADNDDEDGGWYYLKNFYINMYTPWTFVVFNLGDLLGRIGASHVPLSKEWLLPASLVRFGFLGLFVCCPSSAWSHNDCIYNYSHVDNNWLVLLLVDGYSWSVQLFMAMSNGYLTTVAFQVAPTLLPMLPEQEHFQHIAASTILNLSMSLGLWCGSTASFAYVALAQYMLQQYLHCAT